LTYLDLFYSLSTKKRVSRGIRTASSCFTAGYSQAGIIS